MMLSEIPNLASMLAHKQRKQPKRSCRRRTTIVPQTSHPRQTASPPRTLDGPVDSDHTSSHLSSDEDSEVDMSLTPPLTTPDLDGGSPQLVQAQDADHSLTSVLRTAGLASSLYYFGSDGALYRKGKMSPGLPSWSSLLLTELLCSGWHTSPHWQATLGLTRQRRE